MKTLIILIKNPIGLLFNNNKFSFARFRESSQRDSNSVLMQILRVQSDPDKELFESNSDFSFKSDIYCEKFEVLFGPHQTEADCKLKQTMASDRTSYLVPVHRTFSQP